VVVFGVDVFGFVCWFFWGFRCGGWMGGVFGVLGGGGLIFEGLKKVGVGGIRVEIGICSGGIILHIHVGTISRTSGGTPRVGGGDTSPYIKRYTTYFI